jgi:hypothetical protein
MRSLVEAASLLEEFSFFSLFGDLGLWLGDLEEDDELLSSSL